MKKTQLIELKNRIKNNLVSFIAIVMFVTFGIAIFIGLGWSGEAVSRSIDAELVRGNFHDYEVFFSSPISDKDIDELSNCKGIESLEGSNFYYKFFEFNGKKLQAKVEAITSDIDILTQVNGRLPKFANEIVVENSWAKKNGIQIGDRIVFDKDEFIPMLKDDVYVVCGLAESPEYISAIASNYETSSITATPIDCFMFVRKDAFNKDVFSGFAKLLIKSQGDADYIKRCLDDVCGSSNKYTIFTADNNASVSISTVIIDMFGQLKLNMALMFIIIGILICYSSVSRLVYKDIIHIGTKKALGFYKREITVSYLLYAGIASFLGCIIAILLARFAIEPLFASVLGNTYLFETPIYYFSAKEALMLSLIEIACTCISAFIACFSTLKMSARVLLLGGESVQMKTKVFEKTKLWQRTSLFTKCIINNFLKDSRRVTATLIGIAGCTALIVCGITFNNSVNDSFDYQFDYLQKHTGTISYDSSYKDASENIAKLLKDKDIQYANLYSSAVRLKTPDGGSVVAALNVGNSDYDKMFSIYTQDGKLHSSNEGVWLSCAFANNYGLTKGDTLTFIDTASVEHTVSIDGVFEFYMQCPRIVFSQSAYRKVFGSSAEYNTFFIDVCGEELEDLSKDLKSIDGYVGYIDYFANMSLSFSVLSGVSSALAYLYIVLAVLMAIFVLLDLFVMFVEEKKRDLITLMINGYSKKHARKYIYGDTILLSVIGIVLGVLIGIVMGHVNITSMYSDVSYYLNNVNYIACLIAVITTSVLTFIMTKIALKRIDSFSLADLNK